MESYEDFFDFEISIIFQTTDLFSCRIPPGPWKHSPRFIPHSFHLDPSSDTGFYSTIYGTDSELSVSTRVEYQGSRRLRFFFCGAQKLARKEESEKKKRR